MTDWKIKIETRFKKQYKNIGQQRQDLVNSAILEMRLSSNPADLGDYKQNKRVFAYKLGKSDRIIYTIDYINNTIILLRVCDHKSAYGND